MTACPLNLKVAQASCRLAMAMAAMKASACLAARYQFVIAAQALAGVSVVQVEVANALLAVAGVFGAGFVAAVGSSEMTMALPTCNLPKANPR